MIRDERWSNYIIQYQRFGKAESENFRDNAVVIEPWEYKRMQVGGSTGLTKIMHWNVRSINSDRTRKMDLIKTIKPAIVSIQESRSKIPDIRGYKFYYAEPSICQNLTEKINVAIGV